MSEIFSITSKKGYQQAGPDDFLEFIAPHSGHPLVIQKHVAEMLIYGIVHHEKIHLSGPTGQAKTKLVDDLVSVPENFRIMLDRMGYPPRELKIFAVEMAVFECPSELWQRRAIKNGCTYDESGKLIRMLRDAVQCSGNYYSVLHLKEFGRVQSSAVQSGLPDILAEGPIQPPDGQPINGSDVAWICDSNYQDCEGGQYTLVTLDEALKRRFTVHITLKPLSPDQELLVLRHIINHRTSIMRGEEDGRRIA